MSELEWNWETDVLENLNRFTGIDLRLVLGMPKNPLVGDRVLYLMRGGQEAAKKLAEELVAQWRLDETTRRAPSHPYVTNLDSVPLGQLPDRYELRITDLLGELCFSRGQWRYLRGESLLPSEDRGVRWAIGAVFLADQRILVYADLRHPKVGLLFSESFFDAHDPDRQPTRAGRLLERLQGALTLKNRYSRREDCEWVKIVNFYRGPQWVAIKSLNGEISLEQIPYPD